MYQSGFYRKERTNRRLCVYFLLCVYTHTHICIYVCTCTHICIYLPKEIYFKKLTHIVVGGWQVKNF